MLTPKQQILKVADTLQEDFDAFIDSLRGTMDDLENPATLPQEELKELLEPMLEALEDIHKQYLTLCAIVGKPLPGQRPDWRKQ